MVNAGSIVVLSLLLNLREVDMSLAEKFDWVTSYLKVSRGLASRRFATSFPLCRAPCLVHRPFARSPPS